MAGNYTSWGQCRRCHSEVVITRRYDGTDRRRSGYNCGGCWFVAVAKPMLAYARQAEARGRQLHGAVD